MRWQYSRGINSLVMPITISVNGCTERACRQHAARGRTWHAALLRRNAAPRSGELEGGSAGSQLIIIIINKAQNREAA
jgi:hypothetical protein